MQNIKNKEGGSIKGTGIKEEREVKLGVGGGTMEKEKESREE